MDYADNLAALVQYAGDTGYLDAVNSPDFTIQLPVFIFSAENRILRDLDLLAARVTEAILAGRPGCFQENSRIFVLPTDIGIWQVVETLAVIDANGIRMPPLTWTSKEALDALYPDEHAVGAPSIPQYIAPYTASQVLVGPAPDYPYGAQVFGVQFPATLSEDNTTTFISINLPDLFLAAEMIDVSAWCKNFGAMSDNPAQARDWNQEYERLLSLARPWEYRRKVQASGWSTRLPNPVAQPMPQVRAA